MREFLIIALIFLGGLHLMNLHLPRLYRPNGGLLLKTVSKKIERTAGARKKGRESAREYVTRLNGCKKESLVSRSYREAKSVYETIGQEDRYQRTLQVSLVAGALGAGIGLLLRNVLLALALAVGLYFLPLWLSQFALYRYDKYVSEELETALSLITTSYTRSGDILSAVEENLGHLNEPVRGVFTSFCNNLKYVDANAPAQIEQMKGKLNNNIFQQWCDILILCQDNHLLQAALPGIVSKFATLKAQQQSNETRMMIPLKNAFTMAGLVAVVCPGLRMLNLDWYNGLMHTLFGHVSLTAAVIVIFITLNKAIRLSQPITYDVWKGDQTMWKWFVSILCSFGVYCILTAKFLGIYGPARTALRKRAPKPLTQSQVMQNMLAQKMAPLLQLDPIRREQLKNLLINLGHTEPPELFQAHAIAEGLTMGILSAPLLLFSVPLGAVAMLLIGYAFYARKSKVLTRELKKKREAIERELPQFASTIRQSLNSTRDVIAIFTSYRRVCGPALRSEIDKTLNDMMTGNAEQAIKAMESRVASPRLGQLTRGLVAVLRGDDQRVYFDILSEEYRKSQDEEVEQALLLRPRQIYPYMALLGVCFVMMLAASTGQDILSKIHIFFN